MFELMKLPFKDNALAPFVSAETISFHYAKHHQAYVDKVNELISGTEFQEMSLEEIIERTYDKPEYQTLYNNAGQVFNHNIYWNSVGFGDRIDDELKAKIKESFESQEALKQKIIDEALKFFGSGWIWLVENVGGKLSVISTRNGDTPLVLGYKPLLNLDVWEHAYYLDYQNRRKDYVEAFVSHLLKL